MTQGQGGVYLANGSGRDLYITRDPVVFKGISEATPRVQTINPPGAVPRPPSSMARGSRAAGYTGFLPGRVEGVGNNFGKLSEKKDMKKHVPKLRLRHRYVSEPDSERAVTSREYGSFSVEPNLTPKPPSHTRGSATDRQFLPKLKIPKPYTGYASASIVNSEYWKQHTPGYNPASPRKTQRTTASDSDIAFSPVCAAKPPTTTRPLVGLANVPQGYTGYKPRFRYAQVDTDVQLALE